MDTREKILKKALELFNKKGIEYIGMRELATALGMRIGNITYYFATKDDLVFALSGEYTNANSKIHGDHAVESLLDFLKKNEILFEKRVEYQSLLLSMVHIMDRNARIAKQYEKVKATRRDGLESDLKKLIEHGYLKVDSNDELWFLISVNSLVGRFWISEAALSVPWDKIDTKAEHYLKLLAYLFKPYATKKGMKDILAFLTEFGGQ